MDIDQNIIYDELRTKIQTFENTLIDLQDDPEDIELVNSLFRAIHTIKATADILFIFDVVISSHKLEDILDQVRNGKLKLTPNIIKLLFEFKDYLSIILFNVSSGIFDDESAQRLFNYFQQEFDNILHNGMIHEIATVMIVDTSAFTRYAIKKIVLDSDYKAIISDNLDNAYKKLNKENKISLLFISVPSYDDQNIKSKLQHIKLLNKNIKIVLIVAKMTQEIKQYAKEILATAWVSKPIQEHKIKIILDKLLD
jgi:two-component system chemotaxis sensor kinase CheA